MGAAALPWVIGGSAVLGLAGAKQSQQAQVQAAHTAAQAQITSTREALAAQERGTEREIEARQALADQSIAAQKEFANMGIAFQKEMLDKSLQEYAPFKELGLQAAQKLSQEAFGEASPLFKLQQKETEEALNRQLAARGIYGGGRALQLHQQAAQQLTATEAQRQQQLQQSLLSLGAGAAGQGAGQIGQV